MAGEAVTEPRWNIGVAHTANHELPALVVQDFQFTPEGPFAVEPVEQLRA